MIGKVRRKDERIVLVTQAAVDRMIWSMTSAAPLICRTNSSDLPTPFITVNLTLSQ